MDLRVLLIEDSADDAELALRSLREGGVEPQWKRVETEAALREALAGEAWDVALVDYNLPGLGGLQALSVLAEAAPDLPAITVSGAISEDVAVATITAGAVDYVLKDNLTRLAPAVRQAVESADLRRRQRQAAEQARQSQFAVDHASQAIAYVGEDGVLLYANKAAAKLGGIPPEQAVGQKIWGWSPMVDEERWAELWRAAVRRPIIDFEATITLSDSTKRVVLATLEHLVRDEGDFVIVYARDITDQREVEEWAEETEARYGRLTDNAPDIIFRYGLSPVMGLAYINPAVEAITGYSPEECYADPQLMLTMVHPDDAGVMADVLRPGAPPDEPLLMRWIGKDGVTRWMESRIVPVRDAGGRQVAVEGITRDVSERIEADRTLHDTLERLSLAQRASGTGVWDWDMVTGTLTWSPEFLELFGLPPDAEASFDHWRAALHPEDREAAERRIGEAVEERVALRNVYRIVRPEDDERWIETFGETHYDESGTPLRMVGTCVDITERKRAEEKVAQSHDLLEKLARLVPGVVYQYRLYPDGRSAFPYASPGMNDIYEVTPDEVREDATAVFGRLHPDDYQRVSDTIQESARTLQTFYCEFRVVLPRQGLRWRWSQAHPERMEDGGTLWHGIISDITDRKRAEEEVLGQAEQLRRTVEGAVHAMSQVVETRDPYTAGHERRVSELGAAIAAEMGMTGEELDGLRLAGLIHDIGKIAVPAEILAKPGRLSAVEFDLIKQHAQAGYDILQSIEFRRPVALMARQHHERLDGSGYPQGLTGEDILPEARILAVADVVEAMSSHRPYRAALGMEAALAEIRAQAGVKYDGDVAAACLRVVEEQGFHFSS